MSGPRQGRGGAKGRNGPVLTGVFGDPVEHSLSPAMHNAAFRSLGLPFLYLKFRVPVSSLRAALRGVRILGFRGVNLTIPLKEAALGLMDKLTPQAERVGAVNTVTIEGGRFEGHNTDGEGFLRSLRETWRFRPRGKRVMLLGAGGAARAVAFALGGAGAREIVIVNRTPGRARSLARAVARATRASVTAARLWRGTPWERILEGADLIVNATSVGMKRGETPVPPSVVRPPIRVVDLVYSPPTTKLVGAVSRRGVRAMNGEGMLVHQGALAFERWTGMPAPVRIMRRAFRSAMAGAEKGGMRAHFGGPRACVTFARPIEFKSRRV